MNAKWPCRAWPFVLLALTASGGLAASKNAPAQSPGATVRKVTVIPAKDSLSVEIQCSAPVNPQLTKLSNPPRIVVDLPNASFAGQKDFPVRAHGVKEVRVSQFRNTPLTTRVVVELSAPQDYSVTSAGNKVTVSLTPEVPSQNAETSETSGSRSVSLTDVATALASPAAAVQTRTPVRVPSTISATTETSVLSLPRGGELRVCAGTALSVTASQNGRDLMFGISTGGIETDYNLGSNSDVVLTPDFRILMPGPGTFHLAIHADPRGNTCIRTLPGNTASLIVSELMGDGTYQVFPDQQVVFRGGRLSNVSSAVPADCGCPAPPTALLQAGSDPEKPAPPARAAQPLQHISDLAPDRPDLKSTKPRSSSPLQGTAPPVTTAPPPSKPQELHVQIEAPFVFRATEPAGPTPSAVQQLRPHSAPPELLSTAFAPTSPAVYYRRAEPASTADKPRRGLMAKLRGFFANVFH